MLLSVAVRRANSGSDYGFMLNGALGEAPVRQSHSAQDAMKFKAAGYYAHCMLRNYARDRRNVVGVDRRV